MKTRRVDRFLVDRFLAGALLVGALFALAATMPGLAADLATFEARSWGLTIRYPPTLPASTGFRPNAFDRGDCG